MTDTDDPHVKKATELFGVDATKVSPTMRAYAKLRNHAEAFHRFPDQKIGDFRPPTDEEALAAFERLTKDADYSEIERRIVAHVRKEEMEIHLRENPHLDPCDPSASCPQEEYVKCQDKK